MRIVDCPHCGHGHRSPELVQLCERFQTGWRIPRGCETADTAALLRLPWERPSERSQLLLAFDAAEGDRPAIRRRFR